MRKYPLLAAVIAASFAVQGAHAAPKEEVIPLADSKQVKPPPNLPPLPAVQDLSPRNKGDVKAAAYEQLVDEMVPMTPEMVTDLAKRVERIQRARADKPITPPRAATPSHIFRNEPGETPPVIRLSMGYTTDIVVSDSTGSPWPITSYAVGNNKEFFADLGDDHNGQKNVLTLSALGTYVYGNVRLRLLGMDTPVVLTLASDQKEVDYKVNLTVAGRGPNSAAPIINTGVTTFNANPLMTSFLDGVTPAKAKRMVTNDPNVQAWAMGEKYYLRTRYTLFSPGWSDSHSSIDGMHAYEIGPFPVVTVGDVNGQPVQITIDSPAFTSSNKVE